MTFLEKIKQNKKRMEYMAKYHTEEYFILLGSLTIENVSIQDAIEICWEKFKPIEQNN